MITVAPIVEGHGEETAVPALLQRIAKSQNSCLVVNPPIRVKADQFINRDDVFNKYVSLAQRKVSQSGPGFVLILLDCDDGCPAKDGPVLLGRAQKVCREVPVLVALAYREYESWFLAAARSLRGQHGLPADLDPPPDLDNIRNAKNWLATKMGGYKETQHQKAFSACFDLDEARRHCLSFDRFYRKICAQLS